LELVVEQQHLVAAEEHVVPRAVVTDGRDVIHGIAADRLLAAEEEALEERYGLATETAHPGRFAVDGQVDVLAERDVRGRVETRLDEVGRAAQDAARVLDRRDLPEALPGPCRV